MNAIIEIHYYDGGQKSKLISLDSVLHNSDTRHSWLPKQNAIGLHNDINLGKDEFVIELSRHKSQDKLITWIGVYSRGEDKIYGDRGNYNGIGVWLINLLPVSVSLIESLVLFCKHLTNDGLDENIDKFCLKFLKDNSCLSDWTVDINALPFSEKGIIFDNKSYPETLYIQPKEIKDFNIVVRDIAELILTNCINANLANKQVSRVLYLLLSNPKNITDNGISIVTIEKAKPFGKSILERIPSSLNENLEKIKLLEQENKELKTKYNNNTENIRQYKKILEESNEEIKVLKKKCIELKDKSSNTNSYEPTHQYNNDSYSRNNNSVLDKISAISTQNRNLIQDIQYIKNVISVYDPYNYDVIALIRKYIPILNFIFILLIFFMLISTLINTPNSSGSSEEDSQKIHEQNQDMSKLKEEGVLIKEPLGNPLIVSGTIEKNSLDRLSTHKPNENETKPYIIKNGDTLSVIARKCKKNIEDIKLLNKAYFDWDHIKVGSDFLIPMDCELN